MHGGAHRACDHDTAWGATRMRCGISDMLLSGRMPCLTHLELTALKDDLNGLGRCSGHAHDCGRQGPGSLRHCASYKEGMR